MFIYEIPYAIRQRLVDILNVNESWRDLAGSQLNYSQLDLEKFRRAVFLPGDSPADALLTHWGQRNHTVAELFKHLYMIRHFQAMDAIKECVDQKYHKYILYNSGPCSLSIAGAMSADVSCKKVPLPPKEYSRVSKDSVLQRNLDQACQLDYKDRYLNYACEKAVPAVAVLLNSVCEAGQTMPTSSSTNNNPIGKWPQAAQAEGALAVPQAISSMAPGISTSGSSKLKTRNPSGIPMSDPDMMLRKVSFEELAVACNNFDRQNLLGRGGFGEVYRGRWNGQDVAVKRIREEKRLKNDLMFQKYVNQAITELRAIHNFPAENIVSLLAFSYMETMETDPCLVYQYMPNGSVSDRLRRLGGTDPLTWKQRANIAVGTARGLCHLHANNIIHGDIKGPNILLDKHFEPKIGDFGLARGGPDGDNFSYKTVSSVQGTASYLPDDYVRSRHLTASVDTFCYGIFLFELVTGKPPSWQDPQSGQRMRDIMLEAAHPDVWVDKTVDRSSPWAKYLFFLGRDCAKERRKLRPEMQRIFHALERLYTHPAALTLHMFCDQQPRDPSRDAGREPEADGEDQSKNIPLFLQAGEDNLHDVEAEPSKFPSSSCTLSLSCSTNLASSTQDQSFVLDDNSLPMLSQHLQSLSMREESRHALGIPDLPDIYEDPLVEDRLKAIEQAASFAESFAPLSATENNE